MATLKVTVPENSLEIIGIATINAPLAKVFEAYINKDLFTQWFCRGNEVTVRAFNAIDGGTWHVEERSPEGEEWGFYGTFHQVVRGEYIIWTFEYMGMPERGHVSLERMKFVALDDNTTELQSTSVFLTQEDRDGMVASGMEPGWRQSIEALEEVVKRT